MIKIVLTLIAVFLIVILAGIAITFTFSKKLPIKNKSRPVIATLWVLALGAVLFAIFVPGSFHQVETGTIAVVRELGKIVDVRQPGTYFDFYMIRTYDVYDTKVQQDKITTSAYSKDGQTMDLEVFLQYQVQTENIIKIATEYGNLDALQARIETVAVEKTKAVMSSAEAMVIVQNRSTFSNDVSNSVREGISADYYVNVKDVVLTNIDFTNEFEKAVEDKVIAEQEKQASITRAEAELEVAKLEAQKKITEAEGNGSAQKILAQAAAEATTSKIIELARSLNYSISSKYIYSMAIEVSKSTGETSYNSKEVEFDTPQEESKEVVVTKEGDVVITTTTSLTQIGTKKTIDVVSGPGSDKFKSLVEDYIQYLSYLETWNGVLPSVVAGNDAISIIVPNADSTTSA